MATQGEEIVLPPHALDVENFFPDGSNRPLKIIPWRLISSCRFCLNLLRRRKRLSIYLGIRSQGKLSQKDEMGGNHVIWQFLLQALPKFANRWRLACYYKIRHETLVAGAILSGDNHRSCTAGWLFKMASISPSSMRTPGL